MRNLLISFPRSGRAWTLTIAAALSELLPGGMTHQHRANGAAVHSRSRYKSCKRGLSNFNVVLTTRDPRDVVVSYWHLLHFRQKRSPAVDMELGEWVRQDEGLAYAVRFLNDWGLAIAKNQVPRITLLNYEGMKVDPRPYIVDMARRFEVDRDLLTPALLDEVVKRSTAEAVRRRFAHSNGEPDSRMHSVRRAEAGVWREYFSPADAEWVDDYVEENLLYFRGQYA